MKELKFKLSKGSFVVYDDSDNIGKFLPYDLLTKIGYVKSLTEEQASEIVKMTWISDNINLCKFKNYDINGDGSLSSAIESLHSLLKSKGIHLYNNPYEGYNDILLSDEDNKKINDFKKGLLEQKTFYNPYIFKIND